MTTLDDLTLGQLFSTGQSLLSDLENSSLASTDPAYQDMVQDALARLRRASALVDSLAIFSKNEILDDINTQDLQFLLIPAYLGQLTLKQTGPMTARRGILEEAKTYFNTFLGHCQDHQLISQKDKTVYEQYVLADKRPVVSAAQQRQEKIERFKREKAMEKTLAELRSKLEGDEQDGDRDEIERDWTLALLQMQILKSLEHLHSIDQELVMVKEMEAMAENQRRMPGAMDAEPSVPDRRTRPPTWGHDKPLLNAQGRPLQPFVITNKRQQIKNQVFGPGYNLPTMTIEEYLQQEEERGNIIRGGGKEPEKPEIDDNDEAAIDAETMRQREWDEFKEANPRGWGNRMNRG